MTDLAFKTSSIPKGITVVIEAPTVIVCGDRAVAAIPDPNLAKRICTLLNEFGLELGVEEAS